MNSTVYLIHSPGNAVAGGCESLHQLGDAINELGGDAYMCYYPYNEIFDVPQKFSHYNISPSSFRDVVDIIHIFPEVCTKFSEKVLKGRKCIFWLSIDNYYFKKDHFTFFERLKKYYGSLFTARLPLFAMSKCIHLLQSEYSRIHLNKRNFGQIDIGDYIHFTEIPEVTQLRKQSILYNPAKGSHITESLKKCNADLDFFPLVDFTPEELNQVMSESLIYIDFGNHPGRDRLPREVVLRGGIVITGIRGSAGNDIDIPVPSKYKFDTSEKNFSQKFRELIDEIYQNSSVGQSDMSHYKNIVLKDKKIHREKVAAFMSHFERKASLSFGDSLI